MGKILKLDFFLCKLGNLIKIESDLCSLLKPSIVQTEATGKLFCIINFENVEQACLLLLGRLYDSD